MLHLLRTYGSVAASCENDVCGSRALCRAPQCLSFYCLEHSARKAHPMTLLKVFIVCKSVLVGTDSRTFWLWIRAAHSGAGLARAPSMCSLILLKYAGTHCSLESHGLRKLYGQ